VKHSITLHFQNSCFVFSKFAHFICQYPNISKDQAQGKNDLNFLLLGLHSVLCAKGDDKESIEAPLVAFKNFPSSLIVAAT